MSDIKDEFMKALQPEIDLDKKKKEIEVSKVNIQYDRLKENEERYQAIRKSTFGTISDQRADELAQESAEYLEAAAHPMEFINDEFTGVVPFFAKNLILVGAKTGEGKSTCVANVVRSIIGQKNPTTGRSGRCLVITNEENIVDFYNRITCLVMGWHYVNHDQFTEEQKKKFSAMIKILRNRITVVDDTHVSNGVSVSGQTTTVEGIETIFENLMRDGEHYDVVLLDYYQGVTESTKDLTLNEYQVQRRLTHVLEKYRKLYPAPIVVLAQIQPPDAERETPFQVRIQGTKLICTRATMIIEMIAHRPELYTEWLIHKGRYAQSVGESIKTGYKNGLFVKHDDAFKLEVQAAKEQRAARQMDKQMGIKTGIQVGEKVNG
jgi:DnaB-like helicase C terminal domain